MNICIEDRKVLRKLALLVKEAAGLPIQLERRRLWKCSNNLKPERAMVAANPQNGWPELVPESTLVCKDPFLRYIEMDLRRTVFRCGHIHDDVPVQNFINVPLIIQKGDYGLENKIISSGQKGGAYHIDPSIKTYDDLKKLHPASIEIDRDETSRRFNVLQEILGDILEVRVQGVDFCRCGLTRVLIHLRGLDQIMYDMYDNPELLHELMAFLRDEQIREFEFYEKEKVLELNNTPYSWTGSGGICYTDELLPDDLTKTIDMKDMTVWGESQETVGVGPEQFNEFVLQYQLPILNRFGLVDYGCCEGLDKKFDLLIKNISRLRWVAVSPWCNRQIAAEKLGNKYIYVYKPIPTSITSQIPDFEFAEKQLRDTLKIAKDCVVHIVMKDTSTFWNQPWRIEQWTDMAQRVATEMA